MSWGAVHLARRFFGALSPSGPSDDAEHWVAAVLTSGELALWQRMSGPDRRHAVDVARRVGSSDTAVVTAALLHDVGKVESGLGTFERVPATLARSVRRAAPPRWRRYYDHPRLGAALLASAGSDPLVVTWAAEHHLPPDRWTLPPAVAHALKAADDD